MELLSRKATDKEMGAAKKRLETVLGYWANEWGYRILTELPEYVQDLYILYTYTVWLEEQIAKLKETRDDDFRKSTRESSIVSEGDNIKPEATDNDKGGDSVGTVLPEPSNTPPDAKASDGTTGTVLRPDDPNIHSREELDL